MAKLRAGVSPNFFLQTRLENDFEVLNAKIFDSEARKLI